MILNYQYKLLPERSQKLTLNSWLRVCQYWYNSQLGDRFNWWENNRCYCVLPSGEYCELTCTFLPRGLRDNPNYYSQKKYLPNIKQDLTIVRHSGERLDFSTVPSQTLQDVCKRVDLDFKRFIKGDSNGKRSGKPRFKKRYRNLKIEGNALKIVRVEKNWLFLQCSKLKGWLKVRLHRHLPEGFQLKNALITKKADGWFISLCLEDKTVPIFTPDDIQPTWDNSLGVDAVLHEQDYLATSEGFKLPSLKSYRKTHSKLAQIQRKKASKKKGSKAKPRLAKKEGKLHQKIARARKDHAYNTAYKLIDSGKKVIFIEDLNLRGLSRRNKKKQDENGKYLPNGQSAKSGLNKSWSDAFGNFFEILSNIAEKAGIVVKKVNPAYTSQVLPYKDEIVFIDCLIREYYDADYDLIVDRDIVASINVKRVGLGLFPTIKRRKGKTVIAESITNSTLKEVLAVLSRYQKPTLYR